MEWGHRGAAVVFAAVVSAVQCCISGRGGDRCAACARGFPSISTSLEFMAFLSAGHFMFCMTFPNVVLGSYQRSCKCKVTTSYCMPLCFGPCTSARCPLRLNTCTRAQNSKPVPPGVAHDRHRVQNRCRGSAVSHRQMFKSSSRMLVACVTTQRNPVVLSNYIPPAWN